MNEIEYVKLAAVEDTMWWFRGLRAHLLPLVERFGGDRGSRLLDAGCGTGGLLRALQARRPAQALVGIDVHLGAVLAARKRTEAHVAVASVNKLPFPDEYFQCITSIGVLSQAGIDCAAAVAEDFRCLVPGGHLIVQTPAYMWLFGPADVQAQTARRFTRDSLGKLLVEQGFQPCFATYWNSLLLPLVAIRRKVVSRGAMQTDVMRYPAFLDALFGRLVLFESGLIERGMALPFGSSVLVVARKPERT